MSIVDNLMKNVESGKAGRNIGISTGLPDLDKIIYGIQKKYLYVIGGDTSAGKTSLALDVFVYNAVKNAGDRKVNILYYSFEMAGDVLLAKLLSRYIWDEFGEVVTYEAILSLSETISDYHYELIQTCKPWLDKIEKILTIYDKPLVPNHIFQTLNGWLERFGKFTKVNEHKDIYTENDPSEYKIVLIDHIGLLSGVGSKKEGIDLTVKYLIHFRNLCNITGVIVQQLNRGLKAMDRKAQGYELVQLNDFKETSDTTDGAEVVIALYYPHREKIASVGGYQIKDKLGYRFRLVQIIKNRYGRADINKGCTFHGEMGMFRELPEAKNLAESDYEKYTDLFYDLKQDKIDETLIDNNELDEEIENDEFTI